MDDRDFIDNLYALYCATTGGEQTYWRPDTTDTGFQVVAVDGDDNRTVVASGMAERDADWVCSVWGALPDLVRRLHAALDEADRVDADRDARECRIAELEVEVAQLKEAACLM